MFPEAAVPVKVVGAIRGSRLAEKNVVRDTSESLIRLVDERKRETIGLPALPGWDRQLSRTEGGIEREGRNNESMVDDSLSRVGTRCDGFIRRGRTGEDERKEDRASHSLRFGQAVD